MNLNIFYVGQANFTIIVRNDKALVYDCGTSKPSLIKINENFKYEYKVYLRKILKNVRTILVVISHTDDHINLLQAFSNLITEINIFNRINNIPRKRCIYIVNENEEELEQTFYYYRNFFNLNFENANPQIRNNSNYPYIELKAFIPKRNASNNNENSIILKIIEYFENGETYSILLTGDANETSLNNILEKYYEESEVGILDIFIDVICILNPHHGAMTENSYIWGIYVVKISKYIPICIISSNPEYKDGKPEFKMIESLYEQYENKIKNGNYYYDNFYCIPHYISCNLNSELFKFPSYNSGIEMPIFITYDSYSKGYQIRFDSKSIILTDDIAVNIKKIDIPLYEFKLNENYNHIKEKNKMYTFYLAYRNQMIRNEKYDSLNKEDIEKTSISLLNLYEKRNNVLSYFEELEKCLLMEKICEGICNETRSSFIKITNDDEFNDFIDMVLNYKGTIERDKNEKERENNFNNFYEVEDDEVVEYNEVEYDEKKCLEEAQKYLLSYFINNERMINKINNLRFRDLYK